MRHYLVVANQTLGQPQLVEKLLDCAAAGPCDFHVLVPATQTHGPVRWTRAEAAAVARRRLDRALRYFENLGLDVHGEVGDPSPVIAIGEVLRHRSFDELILSTLPPGPSKWLQRDVPTRIEHLFTLPVTLVVAVPEAAEVVS